MVRSGKKFWLSRFISQELYIIWLSFMVHMCKMIISPGLFFSFSKFWFFRLLGGKKAKMVQNDKKFCLLHFISQEPYIMWLSFMVCIYKMIISSSVLFIFPKFWFSGSIGGEKGKKWFRMTKNFVCCGPYPRNHASCDCHLLYIIWLWFMVHMCKMMISPVIFFIFQNFDFGVFMGVKGQKMT